MTPEAPSQKLAAKDLQQVCAELERRLSAGEAWSAEDVFASSPELSRDVDAALEIIYTEFVAREQMGQAPKRDDFCTRFPMWRDGLEQLFEIHGSVGDDSSEVQAGTPFPDAGRRPISLDAVALPGARRIGNYEILGEIGRGGMGVVYKARQVGLNRFVALKMILSGADAGPREQVRFRTEAEAAARLQHPNIVQIHEVGEHEGRPFLSLEYVEGGGLEKRLTGTPWPAAESARLIETLARAIHHAHQQGIVHRDLKPANILIADCGLRIADYEDNSPGQPHEPTSQSAIRNPKSAIPTESAIPKITDFGLARRLARDDADAATGLTGSGTIIGTPAYVAAEQAAGDGREVGPAADVYALGAILYELLTGRPPFQGVSILQTLEQVRSREPLPPGRLVAGLPRDVETICLKSLQKEPRQRYASAAELADDLGALLRGEPVRARPTPAWEKGWKWAKRRPAVASLLGALVVLAIVGLTSVTLLWRQTAAALLLVQQERDDKEAALGLKLVALAHRDWLANDIDQAKRHLDECPIAHRGREWRYLHRVCHACLATIGKPGSRERVASVVWSPDGSQLAWNLDYHTAKIWDLETREERSMKIEKLGFYKLAFTAEGLLSLGRQEMRKAVASMPVDVRIWDPKTKELAREFTTPPALDRWAVSGDGRRLAITDLPHQGTESHAGVPPRQTITVLDDRGAVVVTYDAGAKSPIIAMDLSADGRRLAFADFINVRVLDADNGKLVTQVTLGRADSVAFSPDGRRLALVKYEQTNPAGFVEIHEIRSGKDIRAGQPRVAPVELRGHTSLISTVSFSSDGRRIATASADKTLMIWDAGTGKELFTFRGHTTPIFAVAFSPDNTRLASGGFDGAVRIWDVTPFDEGPP